MRIAILSLGLLTAAGTVRADEVKVGIKDVPKAAIAAVKAKFPEGKITEAAKEEEDGKTSYEVVVMDDGVKIDVTVSAQGKVLEVEKTIDSKKLPKTVAAVIAAKYPKAKIKKAEEVVKYEGNEEEKIFEVVLASEGKKDFEVKLSPNGKILDGADDEDDEKEKGKKDKD